MSANKIDVLARLSADQRKALEKQDELAADLYAPGQSYQEMRQAYAQERRWWNEGGPEMAKTTDMKIATPYGEIRIREYCPNSVKPGQGAIVYIHGGGWVLGNVDTHDRITRYLADNTGVKVYSVEYTLAPEAKFPQAIEECAAVVRFLRQNAEKLEINPEDLAFAGDSGGASLSMGTYIYLREHDEAAGIRAMLLFYGWFGLRDSLSIRRLGGPWDGLSEADFEFYKNLYFKDEADAYSAYANVLDNDLHGLPPAYIMAAELDPLHDDSATLASIYADYGMTHKYVEVPGVIHGFMHHGRIVAATNEVLKEAADFYLAIETKE